MTEQLMWHDSWLTWGVFIIVVLPLSILLLNEVIFRLKKSKSDLSHTLLILRNIILPILAIDLFLVKVLQYSTSLLLIRLLDTFLWIAIINAALSFLNEVIFSNSNANTGREQFPKLLRDLLRFFLVLLGTTIILSLIWQFNLSDLITALGVTSLVIGLALQDTLGNLFSGISLLYAKPFEIGDWVQINEVIGKVVEVNWRSVRLLTRQQELVIIPNLVLGKGIFRNFSQPTKFYCEKVIIGFSYNDPPNKVHQALVEAASATPGILKTPTPEVFTVSYDDFQITYQIRLFISDYQDLVQIRSVFMTKIWYIAKRHQITIPFPIRNIYHFDGSSKDHKMMDPTTFYDTLKNIPAFSSLKENEAKHLMQSAHFHHYGKGEIIIRQGDPTGPLYVITEGAGQVYLMGEVGEQFQIAALSKGDLFGEMALLKGKQSSVTVVAEEDTQVLLIHPDEVFRLVQGNPILARELDQIIEVRRKARERMETNREASKLRP